MVFASPLPEVEIPDVALTPYVLARAAELGDKPALEAARTKARKQFAGRPADLARIEAEAGAQ